MGLTIKVVFMRTNFIPVTSLFGRQIDVLLRQLDSDSLFLDFKLFIADAQNLFSHANEEFIDAIDDIFAAMLWRLHHELCSEDISRIESSREYDVS